MISPTRIWRASTGTGQTSACGSMTKVGQAELRTQHSTYRCLTTNTSQAVRGRGGGGGERGGGGRGRTGRGPKNAVSKNVCVREEFL